LCFREVVASEPYSKLSHSTLIDNLLSNGSRMDAGVLVRKLGQLTPLS
jgi:hypothetical protein